VPPFASNATVGTSEPPVDVFCHCAYNVNAEHTAAAPAACHTPEPSDAVFQPINVYPDLVGTVDDNTIDDPVHV
jgi:hypothetical protein